MENKYKKFDFPLIFCKRCNDTAHDLDYHDIRCKFCKCYYPCSRDKAAKIVEAKYHDSTCIKFNRPQRIERIQS
jgi:hypothetical protein